MPISDRHLLVVCAAAAVVFSGVQARAFEVSDSRVEAAPARALPALPGGPMPGLPNLGIDEGMRKMLRGFRHSYDSGDKTAALKQLEDAAEQGNIAARWKAARMLADGDGVSRDDYRAFRHFSRIADAHGDENRESPNAGVVANSFVSLGLYWRDGIKGSPVKQSAAQAFRMFNYAATYYGDAEGQYQLGVMWLDGSAGGVDPLRAARWLNLAAEKGHASAQAVLGRMLFLGEAMPRHPWRGLMWLQLAKQNVRGEATGWVRELHDKAYAAASEEERRIARQNAERFVGANDRR
jgi:uncharacterized protein